MQGGRDIAAKYKTRYSQDSRARDLDLYPSTVAINQPSLVIYNGNDDITTITTFSAFRVWQWYTAGGWKM
jgi:hypothetical protein